MPIALVTGDTGLLGANLTAAAAQRFPAGVVGVSRSRTGPWPDIRHVQADLGDPAQARELIDEWQPAWVVHCAALTSVDWCESHPDQTARANVDMAAHLAGAASACGARVLYISTDSVFDGQRGWYAEDDALAPLNVYARSKLAGERAVLARAPQALVVRTNFFGWNTRERRSLAEWMLGRLERGEPVPGFEDAVFAPLLANDLSDLLLQMMDAQLSGVYHVGSRDAITKFDFAMWIARTFGLDRGLVQAASLDRAGLPAARPKDSSLNPSKLARALGRPMPSVRAGIERFWQLRETGFAARLKQQGTA